MSDAFLPACLVTWLLTSLLTCLLTCVLTHLAPPDRLRAAHAELRRKHAGAFQPDGKHKRSVLPGRFQRELKPETIAATIQQHQDMFTLLGYSGTGPGPAV